MLPNPDEERQRLIRLALIFIAVALYMVVTIKLWHYGLYG